MSELAWTISWSLTPGIDLQDFTEMLLDDQLMSGSLISPPIHTTSLG